MPRIARHQVLCPGSLSALQEAIVWFVGSCQDPLGGGNEDSHQAQISQERIYGVRVKTELWPLQNCFVFLQDERGKTKRDALFKTKGNKRGRNTSCL